MSNFNPSNVVMHDAKNGKIPSEYNELILKEVIENSKIMQLGKYEEMTQPTKQFQYFAKGPGAYWVGEGEKIKTSKPQYLTAKMEAKKLGVIIPVSREYLTYNQADFFTALQDKISEAFYQKFDEATILGVDNPFKQSIEASVTTADNVVKGGITYDNVLALEDKLFENDYDVNAFISKKQNRTVLRGANKIVNGVTVEEIYNRHDNTIDGLPVAELKSAEFAKGSIYGGDFDYIRYGIPFGMSYAISEDAQLSTMTNEDGTPVNLFEQELVALRVTMDVAFMVIKDEAFAKVTTEEA